MALKTNANIVVNFKTQVFQQSNLYKQKKAKVTVFN